MQDDKIEKALEYNYRYSTGETLAANVNLNSFWLSDKAAAFFESSTQDNYDREVIKLGADPDNTLRCYHGRYEKEPPEQSETG